MDQIPNHVSCVPELVSNTYISQGLVYICIAQDLPANFDALLEQLGLLWLFRHDDERDRGQQGEIECYLPSCELCVMRKTYN